MAYYPAGHKNLRSLSSTKPISSANKLGFSHDLLRDRLPTSDFPVSITKREGKCICSRGTYCNAEINASGVAGNRSSASGFMLLMASCKA
ncbi:MAG: hypothetical protein PHQ41_10190, partial [Candidatus Cloacimonetes bacterium]|nr:hypothetical protein [Candidatus Cloacimonadota bacterium]